MKAFHLEQKKAETELTVESLRLPTQEELDEHFDEVSLLPDQVSLACFRDIDEETFDGDWEDGTWGSNPFDAEFVLIIPVAVVEEPVSVGNTYLLKGVPFTAISEHELLCATFTDYVSPYDGVSTYKEFLGLTDPGQFLGEEYVKYTLKDSDDAREDEEEEEEEVEYLSIQDLSTFETVKFGPYEWLVLNQNEKGKLLITKEAVASRPYNGELVDCTWETCSLRKWLNDEFLKDFSKKEQGQILETVVKNEDNPKKGTKGGNNTKDKAFLLSIGEAYRLFDNDAARICIPNAKAKEQGVYTDKQGACLWWLRSPGYSSYDAALIYFDGDVYRKGLCVNSDDSGVRPALWVKSDS